jgi:hypothetical protein
VEILRNILGNLSSGVIRLVVTVGILAAVGFFIVRPVLDTTEKLGREANESFEKSFNGFGKNGAGIDDVSKEIREVDEQVQRQIRQSFHVAKVHGVSDPKKLVRCIQRAAGDVHRIQRCTVKY